MSEQNDLQIIDVELVQESLRTYQELTDLDTGAYPVMVYLSHPADPYEAKFLREQWGIIVGDHDPVTALIPGTSIDALKKQITEWNGRIALCRKEARQAREKALAEDKRRQEVADELRSQICAV